MKAVVDTGNYASIGVDPRLFRAFEVRSVPTIVVVTTGLRSLRRVPVRPSFRRSIGISGNVTLEYALETFVDGRGPGAAIAAQARARLVSGGGV